MPTDDPTIDYRALVRESYDACAASYDGARRGDATDVLGGLLARLAPGSAVLDLGCGAGVPIARTLASHRHRVTGVDASGGMLRRARRNVPTADFNHADMMAVELPPHSFDAAVAFYSIFHLPRTEHASLFRRVHRWLRPGGYFLCTLSDADEASYVWHDFFGETMFWSNYGMADYRRMLVEAGFELVSVSVTGGGWDEDGPEGDAVEAHPLVLARTTI